MTDTDRLAIHADVPPDLAALVVLGANRADVTLRTLRSSSRLPWLVRERRRVAVEARSHNFSWWQIGRALNRDHSTVIHAWRRAQERPE